MTEQPGRTLIMGVVNVTADSFSDGGRYLDPGAAVARARDLVADGAAIVDVGGESTRPGAHRVPADVERDRVVPVISALAAEGIAVSVDTMRASVAAAALDAGAAIVNDVSGGRADPDMTRVVADSDAPWILMHWRPSPGAPGPVWAGIHHEITEYDDVVAEVRDELLHQADAAIAAGIAFAPLAARCLRIDRIALFRTHDERVFALVNRCPHKHGPLSQGIVHGHAVTCPLHNWRISLETGAALGDDRGCTPTIPVKVDGGRVLISRVALIATARAA